MAFAFTVLLAVPAGHGQEARPETGPSRLPAIVVTEVTTRPLVDRVLATGTVKAVEEVQVQPLVDGLSIRSFNADIGDSVTEGSVLAVLNDDALLLQKSQYMANRAKAEAALAQMKAQVAEAEANLQDARRQRDRARRLSRSGTNTVAQLEQATALVEVSEARLNAARQAVSVGEADIKVVDAQIADTDLRLARTGVKTPVSGTVSARNARIGAIASGAGTPLFTIIRNGAIELVADLSEADIRRIEPGQKAWLTLAGAGARIEGRVRLVAPTVDATTRLGAVHIAIDDESGARPGMYAAAEIVIAEKQALSLPLSSVTMSRTGSATRRVEGQTIHHVDIETGITDGGFVEVVNGLAEGDLVVAKAGAFVRDGDHITPVREGTSAAKGTGP